MVFEKKRPKEKPFKMIVFLANRMPKNKIHDDALKKKSPFATSESLVDPCASLGSPVLPSSKSHASDESSEQKGFPPTHC